VRPDGRERLRSSLAGQRRDTRQIGEEQRRAPHRGEVRPHRLRDRLEDGTVGHAGPHLTPHDAGEDVALGG
jgi:hypothetical protein